eukprot:2102121-Pleurochrysis_carterae.AAC.4
MAAAGAPKCLAHYRNVARGMDAYASSEQGPEYAASNAVDSDEIGSRWSSAWEDPQWLRCVAPFLPCKLLFMHARG